MRHARREYIFKKLIHHDPITEVLWSALSYGILPVQSVQCQSQTSNSQFVKYYHRSQRCSQEVSAYATYHKTTVRQNEPV